MRFYLGTHRPHWLALTDVPLFVSRRTLAERRRLPRALGPWALDSGGFTELSMFGEWRTPRRQYIDEVRRFQAEIGGLAWAAPQDWMCEPHIVAKTGLTVMAHQRKTIVNFRQLREDAPDIPWVPVLQGWTLRDYEICASMYENCGVSLVDQPLVAIGSVCRRQQTQGGREVIQTFSRAGVRLHAFGMKQNGLRECAWMLASSDSLAWSYGARKTGHRTGGPMLEDCAHRSCSNCLPYALTWRERVLAGIAVQQPDLGLDTP